MTARAPDEVRFCAPLVLSIWLLPLNLPLPPSVEVTRAQREPLDPPPDLTPQEARFLQGEAAGDEAENALQRLVDRAAAAPNGIFVACEVPDDT